MPDAPVRLFATDQAVYTVTADLFVYDGLPLLSLARHPDGTPVLMLAVSDDTAATTWVFATLDDATAHELATSPHPVAPARLRAAIIGSPRLSRVLQTVRDTIEVTIPARDLAEDDLPAATPGQ